MTPNITHAIEIFEALHQFGNGPLKVEHPKTGEVCWVLSQEQMEKIRPLFEDDPMTEQERLYLLRRFGERAGWDDPEMDEYDNYDEHRAKQSG